MTGFEIWLIALGLAMDCFAVSIANGIVIKKLRWETVFKTAFLFGLFQGGMPLLGWLLASSFNHLVQQVDHWVAFLILAFLGGRMILGSFKKEDEKLPSSEPTKLKMIIVMAIATSIDALAVGFSFALLDIKTISQILKSVAIIGFVSLVMSVIGFIIGNKFGSKYAKKIHAEFWGGLILIIIGAKILIEHLSAS